MRYLVTLLFAALSLNAFGQVEYPYPYNPDIDNNGFIGNSDLLELLSLYSYEFNAGVLATDSTSAIYYTGNMDYWDCTSSCVGLEGNWKLLDHYLVGTYKLVILDLLSSENMNYGTWLDHKELIQDSHYEITVIDWYDLIVSENGSLYDSYLNTSVRPLGMPSSCFCQTRTSFYLPE